MFTLTTRHVFWWPVTVRRPDPETPGAFTEDHFEIQFEAIPQREAEDIERELLKLTEADEIRQRRFDLLKRVTRDWRQVCDADGQPLTFSEPVFAAALEWPWFSSAVLDAYLEAITGGGGRRKN